MTNDRVVKKLCEWNPISSGLAGRPKIRWENDTQEDFTIIRVNYWTKNASRIRLSGRK